MDEQGKFEFIKELGRGSFGSVVLARNTKTGEQVCLLQAFVCKHIWNKRHCIHFSSQLHVSCVYCATSDLCVSCAQGLVLFVRTS
jgi:serine/threonine protein kinase